MAAPPQGPVPRDVHRRGEPLLEQFYAAEFDHGGRTDTPEGLLAWHRGELESWADTHYELLDAVSDGRTVTWEGAHFFTLGADGRIEAVWALGDTFAKARQLGALPAG